MWAFRSARALACRSGLWSASGRIRRLRAGRGPGGARLLELVHARRQRADLRCQGLELRKEDDQHDEREDNDGDDEKSEDESEESFHGGFSGFGLAVWLFEMAGQRL